MRMNASPGRKSNQIALPNPNASRASQPRELGTFGDDFEFTSEDIVDQLSGELIDTQDVDEMLRLYQRIDSIDKRLYNAKLRIRESLAKLSEGNAKTRRIRGDEFSATLTFPGTSFDPTTTKNLWDQYPEYRDEFLRISKVDVKLREYKKLVNTSGTDEKFLAFRDSLTAAEREPTTPPTVKIEER